MGVVRISATYFETFIHVWSIFKNLGMVRALLHSNYALYKNSKEYILFASS